MKVYCDFHIHSKYSRATSPQMDIKNLSKYGKLKGLNLIGTGDMTHPIWLKELKETLEPMENTGLFTYNGMYFMLTGEISTIYEQGGKIRKIHHNLHVPSFEIAEQINESLSKHGNLTIDGRPTFSGLTSPEVVEIVTNISRDCMITPAHIWTSWFSIFGSKSGFDSIEECYQDQTKHIFSLETGLSSDTLMNFRISKLDKYTLLSNSDCHSPFPNRIGRECNVFNLNKLTYWNIIDAIKRKDSSKFLFTVEFFPEEGKYHYTGHRKCGVVMHPKEAIRRNNICPVCRKKMTVGVLQRVEELADRPEGFIPKKSISFKYSVPLMEIIAENLEIKQIWSKNVWREYYNLIGNFGNEFNIMFDVPEEELRRKISEKLVNFILKIRNKDMKWNPGFDGQYGSIIFDKEIVSLQEKKSAKRIKNSGQKKLLDFGGS